MDYNYCHNYLFHRTTIFCLAQHPKVIAIGETGLDYFRLKGDLEWQRARFRTHIRAARECRKPLIIHTREAAQDTLRLMAEEGAAEIGGVMHCFTESLEVAQAAIEMNFYISFSGIVTFKNAILLKEVAQHIPLESLPSEQPTVVISKPARGFQSIPTTGVLGRTLPGRMRIRPTSPPNS